MSELGWIAVGAAIACALAAGWWLQRRRLARTEVLLRASEAKLEQLQLQFERFAPALVVDQLVDGGGDLEPQRRQVTVLFADLRGFTSLCDALDPSVTVDILNGYFHRMTQAIASNHGHVNQFIGDGLLALFGALESNPWQERDSVLAALQMRSELEGYNQSLRQRGLPELRFGVGIHSGPVVAGVMGAGALFKFDVSGDTVNVASRVEGLTATLGVDLLVTDGVRRALDDRFRVRAMPPTRVKGKPEPVQTYFVEGVN